MLKGKVAVVTGSTSGIGLALAKTYAGQGCSVVINGFGDAAAIETERSGIEKEFGVKALYSAADMSKADEIAAMIATAEKQFGSVDVLVNNAGIQFVAPVEEFPIEKWNQIIAINLSAAFHAIRAAVPGMKARKWGRIINTASAHALVASPFKSAYVSAKHGIAGLTKTVALETATFGITANAICPHGVCLDAAGGKADSRHHGGARVDARAGDQGRAAVGAADQGIRHGGRDRGPGALSQRRHGAFDHRRDHFHRRRLDRSLSHPPPPSPPSPPPFFLLPPHSSYFRFLSSPSISTIYTHYHPLPTPPPPPHPPPHPPHPPPPHPNPPPPPISTPPHPPRPPPDRRMTIR